MASTKILVPDMGDFKDVEIIEVLVKEGQQIKKNDSIVTLESDNSYVWHCHHCGYSGGYSPNHHKRHYYPYTDKKVYH